MANENKHIQNAADTDRIPDQFSGADRDRAEEIWRHSKQGRFNIKPVTGNEVEEALKNVHQRIERSENTNKAVQNPALRLVNSSRYLVAAIALIVFGIGFFMVPKTVTVPNGKTASFELPDGSTIEMNSGSVIRYNRLFPYTNRTLTLNGEAFFSVQPGDEPFIVESNGSVIQVTGTEFNVRSWNSHPAGETSVAVTEGTVRFYAEGNRSESISLNAGQVSRWNPLLKKPSEPETTSSDPLLAWRDRRFVFQETPFIVILNDLERTFDVNISLDAENIGMDTLTAYYNRSAGIEIILDDLCTVKGLRYTKTTDGYRIFK